MLGCPSYEGHPFSFFPFIKENFQLSSSPFVCNRHRSSTNGRGYAPIHFLLSECFKIQKNQLIPL